MIPTSIDGTDITGATIDGTDVQEITVDGQTVFSAGPSLLDNIVINTSWASANAGGQGNFRGMAFEPSVSNITRVEAILGDSGNSFSYFSVQLSNADNNTILQTINGPISEGSTVTFDFNFSSGVEYAVSAEAGDYAFSQGFSNGTSSVATVTGPVGYATGQSVNVGGDNDRVVQEFRFLG
jgi:hypothetical protein